jgi:hypothetical protein
VTLGLLAVLVVVLIRRDATTSPPSVFIHALNAAALFAFPAACIVLFPGPPASEAAMLLGVSLGQAWTERVLPEQGPVSSRWIRALHVAVALVVFAAIAAGFQILSRSVAEANAIIPSTASRLLVPCLSIFAASWIIHRFSATKQSI